MSVFGKPYDVNSAPNTSPLTISSGHPGTGLLRQQQKVLDVVSAIVAQFKPKAS